MNRNQLSILKAIAGIPVVAFVLSGAMMTTTANAETTTSTSTAKVAVPEYLVGSGAAVLAPGVKELEARGQLTEAIAKLEAAAKTSVDKEMAYIYRQEAYRLEKLKREFSVSASEILPKIQARIPGATKADLDEWTAKRTISWITVDGEIKYFRREPGVLLSTIAHAKKRDKTQTSADPAAKSRDGFSFTGHMREALDAAADGTTVVLPVRYHVKHTATLQPGIVPAGEVVRCWLPLPRQDVPQQSDLKIIRMSPEGKPASDSDSSQRTVYFEQKAAADGSAKFSLEFEYTCAAFVPDLTKAKPVLSASELTEMQPYLHARIPQLELTDDVKNLSKTIVGSEQTIVGKAHAIWSYLDENVPWCPEMEYVVMPNIVAKVIAEKRGDCGTQALTFIALCRAAGVPARWQSGWVMKPGGWNMHDWAEFYAPGLGWLPADPSVGRQASDDPAVRDFLFGHMDAYRMIANSDFASEFSPPKQSFRSDPIDNQRGEMEWSGGNLFFDVWAYDVNVNILK